MRRLPAHIWRGFIDISPGTSRSSLPQAPVYRRASKNCHRSCFMSTRTYTEIYTTHTHTYTRPYITLRVVRHRVITHDYSWFDRGWIEKKMETIVLYYSSVSLARCWILRSAIRTLRQQASSLYRATKYYIYLPLRESSCRNESRLKVPVIRVQPQVYRVYSLLFRVRRRIADATGLSSAA